MIEKQPFFIIQKGNLAHSLHDTAEKAQSSAFGAMWFFIFTFSLSLYGIYIYEKKKKLMMMVMNDEISSSSSSDVSESNSRELREGNTTYVYRLMRDDE